jgi:hypothetical protein
VSEKKTEDSSPRRNAAYANDIIGCQSDTPNALKHSTTSVVSHTSSLIASVTATFFSQSASFTGPRRSAILVARTRRWRMQKEYCQCSTPPSSLCCPAL